MVQVTEDLKNSAMVFVKGDANYRRLLGDCEWELTRPFSEVCALLNRGGSLARTTSKHRLMMPCAVAK
jgi:hypothetical protein